MEINGSVPTRGGDGMDSAGKRVRVERGPMRGLIADVACWNENGKVVLQIRPGAFGRVDVRDVTPIGDEKP